MRRTVYALVQVPEVGWVSVATLLPFGGAIVLLALFVWIESRSPAPLVPLEIFRSSTLTGANLVGALLSAAVAVATARTQAIAARMGNSPVAVTGGFQAALEVGAGFAALGILVAVLMIGKSIGQRPRAEML